MAVINDAMARFYFPHANPIGRHVRVRGPSDVVLEIVGVSRDAADHTLRDVPPRRLYVSYLQPIDGIVAANFEIRTQGAPENVAAQVRETIRSFNRSLTIIHVKTVTTLIDESIVSERLVAKLSTFFGALAVLLAAIGVALRSE